MAKKAVAVHIYEPDEAITHYGPPPGADQVTLCGVTDWLGGRTPGEVTKRSVNCNGCLLLIEFIKSTQFD